MSIDLGGIAKGYAVDRGFELLRSLGFKNLIVNAGGDLRVGGTKLNQTWTIGIQDPRSPQKIMARIPLSDSAIATSGDYENFFSTRAKGATISSTREMVSLQRDVRASPLSRKME